MTAIDFQGVKVVTITSLGLHLMSAFSLIAPAQSAAFLTSWSRTPWRWLS